MFQIRNSSFAYTASYVVTNCTWALRFRLLGVHGFALNYFSDAATGASFQYQMDNGAGAQIIVAHGPGGSGSTGAPAYNYSLEKTYVFQRVGTAVHYWEDGVKLGYASQSCGPGSMTIANLTIGAGSSDMRVMDHMLWGRALSDGECAALSNRAGFLAADRTGALIDTPFDTDYVDLLGQPITLTGTATFVAEGTPDIVATPELTPSGRLVVVKFSSSITGDPAPIAAVASDGTITVGGGSPITLADRAVWLRSKSTVNCLQAPQELHYAKDSDGTASFVGTGWAHDSTSGFMAGADYPSLHLDGGQRVTAVHSDTYTNTVDLTAGTWLVRRNVNYNAPLYGYRDGSGTGFHALAARSADVKLVLTDGATTLATIHDDQSSPFTGGGTDALGQKWVQLIGGYFHLAADATVTLTASNEGASGSMMMVNGYQFDKVRPRPIAGCLAFATVIDGGGGYTAPPTVTISGDGTGATAHALLGLRRPHEGTIAISNPGSGYTAGHWDMGDFDGGLPTWVPGSIRQLTGGTCTTPAYVEVVEVDGSGGIARLRSHDARNNPLEIDATTLQDVDSRYDLDVPYQSYPSGAYSAVPSGPVSLSGGTGTGTGATISPTWCVSRVEVDAKGHGYTLESTYVRGTFRGLAVDFAGGGGSGALAWAHLENDDSVDIAYSNTSGWATPHFSAGSTTPLAAMVDVPVTQKYDTPEYWGYDLTPRSDACGKSSNVFQNQLDYAQKTDANRYLESQGWANAFWDEDGNIAGMLAATAWTWVCRKGVNIPAPAWSIRHAHGGLWTIEYELYSGDPEATVRFAHYLASPTSPHGHAWGTAAVTNLGGAARRVQQRLTLNPDARSHGFDLTITTDQRIKNIKVFDPMTGAGWPIQFHPSFAAKVGSRTGSHNIRANAYCGGINNELREYAEYPKVGSPPATLVFDNVPVLSVKPVTEDEKSLYYSGAIAGGGLRLLKVEFSRAHGFGGGLVVPGGWAGGAGYRTIYFGQSNAYFPGATYGGWPDDDGLTLTLGNGGYVCVATSATELIIPCQPPASPNPGRNTTLLAPHDVTGLNLTGAWARAANGPYNPRHPIDFVRGCNGIEVDPYICLMAGGSDDYHYQSAYNCLLELRAGGKLYLELSAETAFNTSYQEWLVVQYFAWALGGGDSQVGHAHVYSRAVRQWIQAATDAGRPDDLVCMLGGQAANTQPTASLLNTLKTLGPGGGHERVDVFVIGNYLNSLKTYDATDLPLSGANAAGLYDRGDPDAYVDLIQASALFHGTAETIDGHRAILESTGYAGLGTKFGGYETGLDTMVPWGTVDLAGLMVRATTAYHHWRIQYAVLANWGFADREGFVFDSRFNEELPEAVGQAEMWYNGTVDCMSYGTGMGDDGLHFNVDPRDKSLTTCPAGRARTLAGLARTVGTPTPTPTPTAATPAFSPAAGTYSSAQSVTMTSSTPSPTIYYTADGTTPTTGSTAYTTPVPVASTTTLKALATASGHAASPVATAVYTITPTPTPAGFVVLATDSGYLPIAAG